MANLPSLVAFGALKTWSSAADLRDLRNSLLQQDDLAQIREAVCQLPALWGALVDNEPALKQLDGLATAQQFAAWISNGEDLNRSATQNNILRLPLTVISHFADYTAYAQQRGISHAAILEHTAKSGGIIGFCVGLLTALALSSSKDESSVSSHAAKAVRLAFAIGAYVDLDAAQNGQTSCLALRWKSSDGVKSVRSILEKHKPAYISLLRGQREATVTAPSNIVSDVSRDLVAAGISVLDTGLTGRYHAEAHQGIAEKVIQSCGKHGNVTFAPSHTLRSNKDGSAISPEKATVAVCHEILAECSDWGTVLSEPASRLTAAEEELFALAIGSESILSSLLPGVKVVGTSTTRKARATIDQVDLQDYPSDAIAVVGLSCKLPGADSPEEFWQMLLNGTSMVEQVPSDRWPQAAATRGNSLKRKFWGNFIKDIDVFDHRFFKKSAREAASMDPQQRLLLQSAYEAMESAGYFFNSPKARSREIGCYLGLCAVDYDANIASHPPNAFSTLGSLRAFLSGKISHFFGWSGPSLTFDTACSSSAVAIHTACRALQANECTYALAGGVALFSSPYLYENLSAAHFLSPTGATKPFDAAADGYCRGEGVGLVVLKKLSTAVADGDEILSVIGASAVNQNDNCVPITVPNAPSQGTLYHKAARMAGISPHQVSFVESHGTGTPVGDPIEMDSIRRVFGGAQRRHKLVVSSVKGNIGHLEGASGVAGLIKAILQIKNHTAAKQASFKSLNPKIDPLEPDRITVPTSNLPLPDTFITACINNYGAAGSNSTIMLMQPPSLKSMTNIQTPTKYPIFIAANSELSLKEYCRALKTSLQQAVQGKASIGSVAYHLARRQNQSLQWTFTTAVSDIQALDAELTNQVSSQSSFEQRPPSPGLVLAFGGQTKDFVGLNEELWKQSTLLSTHLDRCDAILRSMEYPGIYPAIFQSEPISDVIVLHSAIFSLQYASARAWLDCGLAVDAVVGHSLGQLTALVVSGVLSLEDGLKFVAGRASLMKVHWGEEPGSMVLVEADLATITSLSHSLEIACYNGPNSHVMVGEKAAVDEFEKTASAKGLRFKRLQVTNGFHSKFTEPLIAPLNEIASTLRFNKPSIPIETCSDGTSWTQVTPTLLAEHTRAPVYFAQAVQRIAECKGACTWLEAGTDSGVTSMVRRAVDSSQAPDHGFQSMSLSKQSAIDSVAEATLQLWKRGHNAQFWPLHHSQKRQYDSVSLPSYQWEKNRHWLELQQAASAPAPAPVAAPSAPVPEFEDPRLLSCVGQDGDVTTFKVNPRSDEYKKLVSGHVVAGSPLCPATVDIELATRACKMIVSWEPAPLLGITKLHIDAPLGMAADRDLTLTLRDTGASSWEFNISSKQKNSTQSPPTSHVVGTIELNTNIEAIDREFSIYERLTGTAAIDALSSDIDAQCIRGPALYKMFARVVEYGGAYRGLRTVSAKDGQIAGTVTSMPEFVIDDAVTQPAIVDSWMQIAGIHANTFHDCPDDEVCVFTKLDRMQMGPAYVPPSSKTSSTWRIFSNIVPRNSKELSNDIYVFDAESKRLVVLFQGAVFNRLKLSSLSRVLNRLQEGSSSPSNETSKHVAVSQAPKPTRAPASIVKPTVTLSPPKPAIKEAPKIDGKAALLLDVAILFERVAEVPRADVKGHMTTDDLGIDSLMMMEVISELSMHFNVDLPPQEMENLTDVNSLVNFLVTKGCAPQGSSEDMSRTNSTAVSSSSSDAGGPTPHTGLTSPQNGVASTEDFEKLASLLQEHLELGSPPTPEDNLADLGLDSLLAIELQSDMEKMFSTTIDLYQIDETSTVQDLARLAQIEPSTAVGSPMEPSSRKASVQILEKLQHAAPQVTFLPEPTTFPVTGLPDVREVFDQTRFDFDKFSSEEGFTDFWSSVYPDQEKLVLAYIGEAFKKLGCDLAATPVGAAIPELSVLPKHVHLLSRMHLILADGGYLNGSKEAGYKRTSKTYSLRDSQTLLKEMIANYPIHAAEHKLLNVTASKLAECLTGKADPLTMLFANKANRQLLADVYEMAPMCRATTRLLADYMAKAFPPNQQGEVFHFLEVGGGTGGTMRYLVDYMTKRGIPFTYTFTDVSGALVNQVKKTMTSYDCMRYGTVDCDVAPAPEHIGKYHAVISTNCVHATRNATAALANLRQMLRPDGLVALVEFTNGMYWFDLVYGLLDGWWLFSDGRKHALAETPFWEQSMRVAGYKHASWSDGETLESRTLRMICGFNGGSDSSQSLQLSKRAGVPVETVTWKKADGLELNADIYYPSANSAPLKRPVALLLHGGGHVLFTRKDIHMKHIKNLIERGFLPISFDYRLCPEVGLAEGPMTDACDALQWIRSTLPHLQLSRSDVQVDSSRVAAVGWSAGGQLCMTLGHTAPMRGIQAPDVVLAFYCPSNFEADWWKNPILPKIVAESPDTTYDLLEGIEESPIAGYKPSTAIKAPMTLEDPRWRVVIHYNWKAQLVPLLVRGLPTKARAKALASRGTSISEWENLPMPSSQEVQAVSPYAQIVRGCYRTPTFIVHGDQDELIPWEQSRDTIAALKKQGVDAELAAPAGAGHAFDLWTDEDPRGTGWAAVFDGYKFIEKHIF